MITVRRKREKDEGGWLGEFLFSFCFSKMVSEAVFLCVPDIGS